MPKKSREKRRLSGKNHGFSGKTLAKSAIWSIFKA
jgi:hypothetical protein